MVDRPKLNSANLQILVPTSDSPQDGWAWGEVASTTPLKVHLDNSDVSLEIDAINPGGQFLPVGTRVWCQLRGRKEAKRAIVHASLLSVRDINTYEIEGSGSTDGTMTWDRDADILGMIVEVQGAGGRGGGPAATGSGAYSCGQGGGAGGYIRKFFTRAEVAALTATVAVTAGAGYQVGTGHDSSFGGYLTAAGGTSGGSRGPSSGVWGGTTNVGTGGGWGGSLSGADCTRITGQDGMGSWSFGYGNGYMTGKGGDSAMGLGGQPLFTTTQATGQSATGWGAGGGGGGNGQSQGSGTGGNSGHGRVVITEFRA